MLIRLPMQLPAITEWILHNVTPPSPRRTWDGLPRPTRTSAPDHDCRSGSNIAVSRLHLYSTFPLSSSSWGALQLPHIHPVGQTLVDAAAGKAAPLGAIMAQFLATRTLWHVGVRTRSDSNCRSLAELLCRLNRPQGPRNLYAGRHSRPSLS